MEWFIQLHKKICDWEWYTHIPTKVLFFHILLKCNFKEAKWRGKAVKPWEFITSIEHLSLETWLSRQQIRTAIQKLKETWEITHYSTNEYTTLALNNWESYNTPDNKRITNEQQTDNKRTTTTNKNNKENKENKENNIDTTIVVWEQALVVSKWNTDINELLETIKWQVEFLWLIYKKWKYERERAKNILTGKDFWEVCEKANMPRVEFCKQIIFISSKLDFWNWKVYNAETIYKHYAQVYNEARNKKQELENKTPKVHENPLCRF